MAEPPPAPAVPPADGSDPIALNAVIGITVGGTVGLVLFLICCICCIKRCNKRRRGFRQDLEQPLDLKGDGGSSNTNPILSMRKGMGSGRKESELVVSKAVDANLDDHDLLVANGLNPDSHSPGKLSQVNMQLQHSSSAHARLQQTPPTAAAGGGGSMSILRWLENAELPRTNSGVNGSSTSPTAVASGHLSSGASGALPKGIPLSRSLPHGSSRFSGFSMRAIIGRLDTGELAEMRRRLLLAAGTVYHGDSSAVPLDVKGIVFARLPPSRMASPAPSTVMDTASVANSGISRSVRVKRNIDLTHPELGTPEQQAQQASVTISRSLTRHGTANSAAASAATPAVYVGSAGGVTFASIGSLARTSLRAGVDQPPVDQDLDITLPVSRNAWGSPPRYVSGAGVIPGQTVDPSMQSQAYNHAMVLEQAGKGSPQQQVNGLPPRVPGAGYIPSRSTPTRNHTAQHTAVTDPMSEGGLHGAPGDMTVTLGPLSGSQYGASSASSLNMFQFPTVEAKGQVVGTPKAAHQMTGQ